MKKAGHIIENAFTFFCIGFTVAVLASLLLGGPPDIRIGLLLGSAMAAGQVVRFIFSAKAEPSQGAERSNG